MTTFILAQLAAPASGAIETWLLSAAAVASMALLVKKLFLTKTPHEPEYVTCAEFYREMSQVREKIERGFLATRDSIEQTKGYLALATEKQVDSIHRRLNELESGLARVDERTKN